MFIHVEEHHKCSKCKAIDRDELVVRRDKTFRRCRGCGHEVLHSTLTVSVDDEFRYYAVSVSDLEKPIEF